MVKKGDVLFSYETDKASFDYQSEVEGEVLVLFCEEGDEVPVLTNVCVVGKKGDDVSYFAPEGASVAQAQEVVATTTATVQQASAPVESAPVQTDGKIFASPRAKHLAEKLGVDPAVASGPLITTVNDLVAVVISDKSKWKFGVVRIVVDVCFAGIGFLLGGTLGVGTIICAFLVGPTAQIFFPISEKICRKVLGD